MIILQSPPSDRDGRLLRTHLWIEHQLLFVKVEESYRVGLGVVDKDLKAGIQGRALAVRPTREDAFEHLLRPEHGHHGAVGGLALHALEGRAEPAEAENEERQNAANYKKESQSNTLIFRLRVLV